MLHSGIFPIFFSNTPPSFLYISHSPTLWVLLSLASSHGHISAFRPSPAVYWYTFFFFVAGPGYLHEILAWYFRKSLGPCKVIFIPTPSLISRISSSVPAFPLFFLALAFPIFLCLFLLVYCTAQTYVWRLCILGVLLYPSYSMDYVIPPYSSLPYRRGGYMLNKMHYISIYQVIH